VIDERLPHAFRNDLACSHLTPSLVEVISQLIERVFRFELIWSGLDPSQGSMRTMTTFFRVFECGLEPALSCRRVDWGASVSPEVAARRQFCIVKSLQTANK
jgi:hypothetical protein